MKILSFTWTIYDDRIAEFSGDCTGGGLVIKNICEYLGRQEESYLFIGKHAMPDMMLDHIHIVQTDPFELKDVNSQKRNELYLKHMTGEFEKIIRRIQPDIVNFHGIGLLTQYCIEVCYKYNLPCVYTEHLFIGKNKSFNKYDTAIEWEEQLYHIPNLRIIAVSNGMRNKILNTYPFIDVNYVTTILNGTNFKAQMLESDLSEKYGLSHKKVLLCVGTLLERKNQRQLVSSYLQLPIKIRENVKIIFCGNDRMEGMLQRDIEIAGLKDDLIYAGAISSDEMKKFYSIANGLIMPSLAEGFSIAMLEAIAYGLPVIMFKDSECAIDLKDENVVCFADDRTDEALAASIIKWYNQRWDRKYIEEYSSQFTMEKMAEDYLNYYKLILSGSD